MSTDPKKYQPLPPHRFAKLFPAMAPDEYRDLVDDIRKNGLRQRITTIEENGEKSVLDGIHRQDGCIEAGVKPHYEAYQGNDPLGYVISQNAHRRHLSPSQRGALAADIANMRQGERTDLKPSATSQVSLKAAADAMGASERTAADAAKVKKEGDPTLFQAVKSGDIPASVAADLTHAPPEQQREAVESIERDDKGKPTTASKKKVKSKAQKAKSSSRRTSKSKSSGSKKTAEPKAPGARDFKDAVQGFASDADHLFRPKQRTILEDERMPDEHRTLLQSVVERLIENATALRAELRKKHAETLSKDETEPTAETATPAAPAPSKPEPIPSAETKAETAEPPIETPTVSTTGTLQWRDVKGVELEGKTYPAAVGGARGFAGAYAVLPKINVGKLVGFELKYSPRKTGRALLKGDTVGIYPTMARAKAAAEEHKGKLRTKTPTPAPSAKDGDAEPLTIAFDFGAKPKTGAKGGKDKTKPAKAVS